MHKLWKAGEVEMTDQEKRGKVIRGLTAHYFAEIKPCNDCPYFAYANCEKRLASDAIALLKAQEPRVMGVGDFYDEDMGFYERKDEEFVWPVLIANGGPDGVTVSLIRKDAFEIKADCSLMNQTWRIWTTYPTHEQREAAKWK